MGQFRVEVMKEAAEDIAQHKKSGEKSSIKKIEKILVELSETPYDGVGKPEALLYEMSGKWSRKINKKDRMIYAVNDETVTVLVISVMGD
jgi:toxin YoeB